MALNMTDAAARHPGSYPFLLVDKVLGMESGTRAIGLHNVTANDPLLAEGGRRPHTMRRALLVEAFAQLSAMALGPDSTHPAPVELTTIESMTFTSSPTPGDQVIINVELAKDGDAVKATCNAEVGGEKIAEGMLVFEVLGE